MGKSVAVMQPYFFPYIGYWHLINSVDEFIVYDDIQYTKKGWINRNRYLTNGRDEVMTIPLKKDSDFLDIRERFVSDDFDRSSTKLLNKISASYRGAGNFEEAYTLFENCIKVDDRNLFDFILNSILQIKEYLGIETKISVSSKVCSSKHLVSAERVKYLCKKAEADCYINAIGGLELYDCSDFKKDGLDLKFIKSKLIQYEQAGNEFIPWLSMLDVIMFNKKDSVIHMLNKYEII